MLTMIKVRAWCALAALGALALMPQKMEAQTLEETLSWISDNFDLSGWSGTIHYLRGSTQGTFRGRISFSGCDATYWDSDGNRLSFHLGDLETAIVKIEDRVEHSPPMYLLSLGASTGVVRQSGLSFRWSVMNIPFQNEATSQRFRRAFVHAMQLCKRQQPF
jgi:hypothetical protein